MEQTLKDFDDSNYKFMDNLRTSITNSASVELLNDERRITSETDKIKTRIQIISNRIELDCQDCLVYLLYIVRLSLILLFKKFIEK